jgi:hypothetical protein
LLEPVGSLVEQVANRLPRSVARGDRPTDDSGITFLPCAAKAPAGSAHFAVMQALIIECETKAGNRLRRHLLQLGAVLGLALVVAVSALLSHARSHAHVVGAGDLQAVLVHAAADGTPHAEVACSHSDRQHPCGNGHCMGSGTCIACAPGPASWHGQRLHRFHAVVPLPLLASADLQRPERPPRYRA